MAVREIKLVGKYIVEAKLEALTGLHIGTSKDTMKIGDVDNPVIRDVNGIPYIPGSSLKGKMRALMELFHGKLKPDTMVYAKYPDIRLHMCDDKDCQVCGLFGRNHGSHSFVLGNEKKDFENISPTRLIVRDAKLIRDSFTEEMLENLGGDYTEVKFENNLDRITSEANPRQTERVPAGAKFDVSMVVNRYAVAYDDEPSTVDDGIKYLKELLIAMQLLEDDYLGGQGSRGYGKVKFEDIKITYKDIVSYAGNKDPVVIGYSSVEDAIKHIEEAFKTI